MKYLHKRIMTYYAKQVKHIRHSYLPDDELCERIRDAKHYIDTRFSENINLDRIAGQACYSKFHFRRLFKQLYGLSPHQYLTFVRINKAKQLLLCSISTGDVCLAVGFTSVS